MNQNLNKLIEVNKLDIEFDNLNLLINDKYAVITKIEKQINNLKFQNEENQKEINDLDNTIEKNNNSLAEHKETIKNIKEKQKDTKSEKELSNLNYEEDIVNERLRGVHEEILKNEKQKENLKGYITENILKIETLQLEISKSEENVQIEIDKIKENQNSVYAKKQNLIMELDQNVLSFYEKIRKWAHNTSIVPIYKSACGGCFIKLNDKTQYEVRNSPDIINCPHCGRILYSKYEEEIQEDKQEKESV